MLRYIDTQEPYRGEAIDGVTYPMNIAKHWTEEQLSEIGLEDTMPTPPPPTIDQLYDAAAQHRWAIQVSSTTVDLGAGDVSIPTHEGAITLYKSLRDEAIADANFEVEDYRVGDNTYITATAAQLIAIYDAAWAHIQACYSANKLVDAKIADETYTTREQVVNAAEWGNI